MVVSPAQNLHWEAVPGATSYEVDLLDGVGALLATFTPTTSAIRGTTLFAGRAPGPYAVRVRARTGTDLSADSEQVSLDLVAVLPPTGIAVF